MHAKSGDTDSVSDTIAVEPTVVGLTNFEAIVEITALACHGGGEHVFCGKDNGAVTLYSTTTGKEVQVLYQHAYGIAIHILDCRSRSNVLVSADAWGRFMVWKIVNMGNKLAVEGPLLDAHILDYPISQVLLNSDDNRLLVSTIVSDTIYDIKSGVHNTITFQERASWKCINHPRDPSKLIHISSNAAHIYAWNELSEPHSSADMKLASHMRADMSVKDVATCSDGCKVSVEFSKPHNQQSTSHVLILSASSFEEPLADTIESLPLFSKISSNIEHLIGSRGRKLLFLDRRMWVCSVDLEAFKGEYYQHCFIPNEWLSADPKLILRVTTHGDLIFVKRNEIAVIKRALENQEAVIISTN